MAKRRRFGSVYRRGGIWVLRYQRDGRDVRRAIGPNRRDAEAALAEIETTVAREEALGVRAVAKAGFCEAWEVVSPVLRARLSPYGFKVTTSMFGIVRSYFGARVVSDVDGADVEGFLAWLRNERETTAATANRYAAFLSRFFAEASARGLARGNPVKSVHRAKEELRAVPFLAMEDVRKIEAHCPPVYRPIVGFAAETGCRRGELVGLEWPDVSLSRRRIIIRRSKSKRPREVPLTAYAVAQLESLLAARAPVPMEGADPVFRDVDGATLSRSFPRWAKAAGFPRLRFHDLRHAWASRLMRAGVPATDVQKLGGWGSLRMVERYGSHAPADAAEAAVAALERAEAPRATAKAG